MLLQAWKVVHLAAMRDYLEAENERLTALAGKDGSIWTARQLELVALAQRELGMSRQAAERETVGQLRLMLKEARAMVDAVSALPKGLQRMRLAELQSEAAGRGLEIMRADGKTKCREELIRDIKDQAGSAKEASARPEGPPARPEPALFRPAPRAKQTPRPRSLSVKRPTPDPENYEMPVDNEDYLMLEVERGPTSSASQAGRPAGCDATSAVQSTSAYSRALLKLDEEELLALQAAFQTRGLALSDTPPGRN